MHRVMILVLIIAGMGEDYVRFGEINHRFYCSYHFIDFGGHAGVGEIVNRYVGQVEQLRGGDRLPSADSLVAAPGAVAHDQGVDLVAVVDETREAAAAGEFQVVGMGADHQDPAGAFDAADRFDVQEDRGGSSQR